MDLVMNLFVVFLVFTTVTGEQMLYRLHQTFDEMENPAFYFSTNSRVDRIADGRKQSKNPIRFDDYIDDYQDDSSYTVGTQINVGHQNSKSAQKYQTKYRPKYDSHYEPSKATSYTSYQIKHEDDLAEKFSGKIKQKPKKKQYFKPVHEHHDEDTSYQHGSQVYPSGREYSKKLENLPLRNVPNLYSTEQSKRYRNVASKGQISKYLEDQQKAIEEADQFHLINDPTSSSRQNFRQYFNAKDDESNESEYEDGDDSRRGPESFYGSSKKIKSSKRPQIKKKSPRKTSIQIPHTQGLGSFRSPKTKAQTIRFHLDI